MQILLNRVDGRQIIYRRKRERYNWTNFVTTVAYCGGSIMVWLRALTDLVVIDEGSLTANRCITEILSMKTSF